ncbi:alginate O-acetyltransferase AlgX-related protein [Polaromonas sp. CT11-55]
MVFLSFFVSLLIIPVINILSVPDLASLKWSKAFFYNMDFAVNRISRLLYPYGISVSPKQVIIGRDGWLYLGDKEGQTLTVDRSPPTEADRALGEKIGSAAQAWDAYLSGKGVKLFRIMVGPNKGSIYPDQLPVWARPPSPNVADTLFAGTGELRYIDLRKPLLVAKALQLEALYYKADTHWNRLGAGIAFRAFGRQVAEAAPELRWPPETAYEIIRVEPRAGGDLANFLRIRDLPDVEPVVRVSDLSVQTTQFYLHTKTSIRPGGNPVVGALAEPILVTSEGALNYKKVLWLRDSFGIAMSPFMAATFSDVLQISWHDVKTPEKFAQLIDEFKPEYVFVTVVERDSREKFFITLPPAISVPEAKEGGPATGTGGDSGRINLPK